jgi:D-alanyl-D-alanine carboxypeptidase/D-alanyl-D-alanine-endopeptidase (penicillin-binding protein 4)
VPVDKLIIKDGSGLSEASGVPPEFVAKLMVKIKAGGQNLNAVYNSLPVSGTSGSLASRLGGATRGHVIAKTGWIDTAYTLGGVIEAADGTVLTFAFYAIGNGIRDNAKGAIDTLVTSVFNCGDNLSNI